MKFYSRRNQTLKVRFHLKKNSNGSCLLMVHFNLKWSTSDESGISIQDLSLSFNDPIRLKKVYKPLKFSTRINIHEGAWNQKSQKAINNYEHINKRLENIREIGDAIFNKLSKNGAELVEPESFKSEWLRLYQPQKRAVNDKSQSPPDFDEIEAKVKLEKPFTTFCRDFITQKEQSKLITRGTAKSYLVTIRKFEQFQSEILHKEILIGSLNNMVVSQFVGWLNNQKKTRKQLSGDIEGFRVNYLSKQRSVFKRFIIHLKNEEQIAIPVNPKKSILKKRTEKTSDIALSKEQIKQLHHFSISNEEEYYSEMVSTKDLFIIGCFLGGLRISDLNRLGKMELKRDGEYEYYVVHALHKKTRNLVELPVHPYVLEIYQKYKNSYPVVQSNVFNKMIKIIGLRIGWTDTVDFHLSDVLSAEPATIEKPFYSLLKSSTCRRTFCTLLFKDGWSLDDICAFSGHHNITSLLHYIKFKQQSENVLKLYQKWGKEDW